MLVSNSGVFLEKKSLQVTVVMEITKSLQQRVRPNVSKCQRHESNARRQRCLNNPLRRQLYIVVKHTRGLTWALKLI